jgi:hypothetical protein
VDVHECRFDEVIIGRDDEDGALKAGMKVIVPCACGELPLDHLSMLEMEHADMSAALLRAEPQRPLFHWSPSPRRKQIERYGLKPWSRHTASSARFEVVCFADTPSWAWALSAGMSWTPQGSWDLWQTSIDRLDEPVVLGSTDRPTGLHEVRTTSRVYKRDLWYVGSRMKG